jgi:hypothetical protein
MKHLAHTLVTLILVFTSLQAQSSIDIQGGLNITKFSAPGNLVPGAVWTNRIGFVGGWALSFPLADELFLSPGLRFVDKGVKSQWSGGDFMIGNVETNVTNAYLEVPIYLKYRFVDNGSQLFVIGGPAVGYLMRSRSDVTTDVLGSESFDTKGDYKSYDISIDFGLFCQIPVAKSLAIAATGAYSIGVVKISQMGSNERTRDVRVTVGVLYSFK